MPFSGWAINLWNISNRMVNTHNTIDMLNFHLHTIYCYEVDAFWNSYSTGDCGGLTKTLFHLRRLKNLDDCFAGFNHTDASDHCIRYEFEMIVS